MRTLLEASSFGYVVVAAVTWAAALKGDGWVGVALSLAWPLGVYGLLAGWWEQRSADNEESE